MDTTLPLAVQEAIGANQVLVAWYQYGVLIAFVLALVVTAWVFLDSRNGDADATIWKVIGAVGSVLLVPFLLARLSPDFAIQMAQSLTMLAYVSVFGLLLALIGAGAHTATRRAIPETGPVQPVWPPMPADAYPPQAAVIWPPQAATDPTAPTSAAQATIADAQAGGTLSGTGSMGRSDNQKTEMLYDPRAQAPLAFLTITTPPNVGRVLKLKSDDVTRIGRGTDNDHVIDDPHVSRQHVSIRHRDGQFVLRDLDALTRTYVRAPGDPDFREVVDHVLHANDRIRIGKTELVFLRADEQAQQSHA